MYLESKETKGISPTLAELQALKVNVAEVLNATSKEVDDLFSKLVNALESSGLSEPYKWDYYESCFYVGSLLTTIGKYQLYVSSRTSPLTSAIPQLRFFELSNFQVENIQICPDTWILYYRKLIFSYCGFI